MAQELRTHSVLAEDPGLVHSTLAGWLITLVSGSETLLACGGTTCTNQIAFLRPNPTAYQSGST